MRTLSITEARKVFYQLVKETADNNEPIQIKGKHNDAVLISAEDWGAIQETLHLLSIPGMRESIIEGLSEDLSNTEKELDW